MKKKKVLSKCQEKQVNKLIPWEQYEEEIEEYFKSFMEDLKTQFLFKDGKNIHRNHFQYARKLKWLIWRMLDQLDYDPFEEKL